MSKFTFALGTVSDVEAPVQITRPDGETVTVTAGPYVFTMPGEYVLDPGTGEPLRVTVE